MRNLIISALMIMSIAGFSQANFHDFVVKDINGNDFSFNQLVGKKVMVVNTASKCGLTPQYEGLEKLYQEFGGSDFVIIGFPANDFLRQEPGTDDEIKEFCSLNYGVTFPMMSKIKVKGSEMHPLYQFLTQVRKNGHKSSTVSWNFQKYLIGTDGKLSKIIPPRTAPMSEEVINWVEEGVMAVNERL